jgi:hypothetical protein
MKDYCTVYSNDNCNAWSGKDLIVTYVVSLSVSPTGASTHVEIRSSVISTVAFKNTSNGNSKLIEILKHFGGISAGPLCLGYSC